jgi:hypothetical protein
MDITNFDTPEQSDNPFVTCDTYIKSAKGAYLLANERKEKFTSTLDLMFKTIQKLDNDEKLDEDFTYQSIEECLNFLYRLPIELQIDDDMAAFIKAFIFIAYNINENLEKYEAVREKIAYIHRYCDNAMTYSETLKLMAASSIRLNNWRNWTPPSFRLSEHYYNLLKGD